MVSALAAASAPWLPRWGLVTPQPQWRDKGCSDRRRKLRHLCHCRFDTSQTHIVPCPMEAGPHVHHRQTSPWRGCRHRATPHNSGCVRLLQAAKKPGATARRLRECSVCFEPRLAVVRQIGGGALRKLKRWFFCPASPLPRTSPDTNLPCVASTTLAQMLTDERTRGFCSGLAKVQRRNRPGEPPGIAARLQFVDTPLWFACSPLTSTA